MSKRYSVRSGAASLNRSTLPPIMEAESHFAEGAANKPKTPKIMVSMYRNSEESFDSEIGEGSAEEQTVEDEQRLQFPPLAPLEAKNRKPNEVSLRRLINGSMKPQLLNVVNRVEEQFAPKHRFIKEEDSLANIVVDVKEPITPYRQRETVLMKDLAKERYEVILTYNDILREKQKNRKEPVFPEPDSLEKELEMSRISQAAIPSALDHLHERAWKKHLRKHSTEEASLSYNNAQIVPYDQDARALVPTAARQVGALVPHVAESEITFPHNQEPTVDHAALLGSLSENEEEEALAAEISLKAQNPKNAQYHYLISHRFALARRKSRRNISQSQDQQVVKHRPSLQKLTDLIQLKNEKGDVFTIENTPENQAILEMTQSLDVERLGAWQTRKMMQKIEENKVKRKKKLKEKERAQRLKQILEEDEIGIYGDKEDIEKLKEELAQDSDSEEDEATTKAAIKKRVEDKQKSSKPNTAAPSVVQLLKLPESSQSSLKGTRAEVSKQLIAMLNRQPGKLYEENFGIPVDIKDIHPSSYMGAMVQNKTVTNEDSELAGAFKDRVLDRSNSNSKEGEWSRRDSIYTGQHRSNEMSRSGMSRRTQMWSARGGDTMRSNPNESMALNQWREEEAAQARKVYEVKLGLKTDYVHNSHLVKTAEERAINPKYYENMCDYPELEGEKEKSGKFIGGGRAKGTEGRGGAPGRLELLAGRHLRSMRYQVGSLNERHYNAFLMDRQSPQLDDTHLRSILRLVQRDLPRN